MRAAQAFLPTLRPDLAPSPACRRRGSRWLITRSDANVRVEGVRVKDQYETPAWIWRHYVDAERLQVDVHATALNAVLPEFITADEDLVKCAPSLRRRRLWLNPAFGGGSSGSIARALGVLIAGPVRQSGRQCAGQVILSAC